MKLALEGKLAHGGHPVLSWMVDNIHIRQDPAGNINPDKQRSTEKSTALLPPSLHSTAPSDAAPTPAVVLFTTDAGYWFSE